MITKELLLKPTCVKMLVLLQSHVSLATEVIIHNLLSSSHFISDPKLRLFRN